MTRDNDIERVLEHWFGEGPTRMPDRVLVTVTERIDGLPKRRFGRLLPRFDAMTAGTRLAAIAAAIVVAVGGGAAILTRFPSVGTTPSPTASASPSAGPGSPLPSALYATWASFGLRQIPDGNGGSHSVRVDLTIGPTTVKIPSFKADIISSASLIGTDTIALRTVSLPTSWGCQAGDEGTYTFALLTDRGGEYLTLSDARDACSARVHILVGAGSGTWDRTEMGDLTAGEHVSTLFRPFENDAGRLAYTVPSGWADNYECANCLYLARSSGAAGTAIGLYGDAIPASQDAACNPSSPRAGATAVEVATWLKTLEGLVVGGPEPVIVGGLSGVTVDLSIAPGWTNRCSYSQSGGPGDSMGPPVYDSPLDIFSDASGAPMLSLALDTKARYILLDRGDGRVLVIGISTTDTSTFDAGLADAMPVVETFEFRP